MNYTELGERKLFRKTISGIMLILLLTSISTIAFMVSHVQLAQATGTVGVKAGDWIKYIYIINGAPPGTPLPTWLKVEFLSVEGTNATVRVTMHMTDGTEQNQTLTINIVTAKDLVTFSGFVIPANRTEENSIYISGYGNVPIDNEGIGTYAGASRTVVWFLWYAGPNRPEFEYCWDKQTGVMVEASTISGNIAATAKATETNMWQAQPLLTTILVYPSEITVPPSETFTVNVTIADVTDLCAWQVKLYFNSSILNCTTALYPEDHIFAGKDIVSLNPVIDNMEGYVLHGCCLLGEEENFNGSGTLFQIKFKALPGGASLLMFSGLNTYLLDYDIHEIPCRTQDGYVTTTGVTITGDLNIDGKVDIQDVVVAAKAFGSYLGHPRWNPLADINKDGIVNVIDIVLIAKNFGKTL